MNLSRQQMMTAMVTGNPVAAIIPKRMIEAPSTLIRELETTDGNLA